MPDETLHKFKKIPAIQGLRALSLITVLIFHIDHNILPSGYLGVDAFFAISGFVITLLIYRRKYDNTFTYQDFYLSRVTRLLPSLFTTILFTLIIFRVTFGINNDLIHLANSAIAATLSVSNIYFFLDSGYFSSDSIYKPLLHTWSLGVEEQFYLLYPVFVGLLLRYGNTATNIKIILLICLICLSINFWNSSLQANHVFYLSPYRAYQFLLGAFFAFAAIRCKDTKFKKINKILLHYALPTTLIIFCTQSYAPGKEQTLIQFMTALLVSFGCFLSTKKNSHSEKGFLSNTLLVKIGDYSYSIYLVHWPIIVWLFYFSKGNYYQSIELKGIALIASFLLGMVLYHFIDNPLRPTGQKKNQRKNALIITICLALSCLVLSLFYKIEAHKKYQSNEMGVIDAAQLKALKKKKMSDLSCHIPLKRYLNNTQKFQEECFEKNTKNTQHILLIGDSLNNGIRVTFDNLNNNFLINSITLAGCPPYFGKNDKQIKLMQRNLKACRTPSGFPWSKTLLKNLLHKGDYDAIIISGNWYAKNLTLEEMSSSLKEINNLGKPIYLFGIRPFFKESIPRLLESQATKKIPSEISTNILHHRRSNFSQKDYNEKLKQSANSFSNIIFFDIYDTLCPHKCKITDENQNSLYTDNSHLSVFGASFLANSPKTKKLAQQIVNVSK